MQRLMISPSLPVMPTTEVPSNILAGAMAEPIEPPIDWVEAIISGEKI